MNHKPSPKIKHLKLLASRLSKEQNLSRSQALDRVSVDYGYKSWHDFKLDASNNHDSSKVTVPIFDYDPVFHSPRQIEGFEDNRVQITQRIINFVHDDFPSLNSLRHELDKNFKQIDSNFKDRFLFCVHIYISFKTAKLIKDEDKFFQAFVDRNKKVFTINKVVTDVSPSIDEIESTISEFNSYFQTDFNEV
jgi:hypothetical protein